MNRGESAEVAHGAYWDYYYLYECNTVVASVFGEYYVG